MKEMKKEMKVSLKLSLFSAGLITLFWAIWYLAAGEVPVVESDLATGGVSHWWDIAIGPIWSTLLVVIFTSKLLTPKGFEEEKDQAIFGGLYGSAIAGLFGSLLMWAGETIMTCGFIAGGFVSPFVAVPFICGLLCCGCEKDKVANGLKLAILAAMSFTLGFSLLIGLIFGLAVGIQAILAVGQAIFVGVLVCTMIVCTIWAAAKWVVPVVKGMALWLIK